MCGVEVSDSVYRSEPEQTGILLVVWCFQAASQSCRLPLLRLSAQEIKETLLEQHTENSLCAPVFSYTSHGPR